MRHRRDRLARARLADDREHLAAAHVEADAVDRLHHAVVGVERRVQVAHRQQHLAVGRGWAPARRSRRRRLQAHRFSFGSKASRRPSPTKQEGQHGQKIAAAREEQQVRIAGQAGPRSRLTIRPHAGVGACGPTPRNDSAASARIAAADRQACRTR